MSMSTLVRLETHLHTSEVSQCGRIPAREMIRKYHAAGYGAVVVTDHFLPGRFRCRAAREAFLTGYRLAAQEGEALGLTVLPGMELRFAGGDEDFLVYGLTEQDIIERLPDAVCEDGLPAFHALCRARGWLIYQAHPFRPHLRAMPAQDLDGVETRNCNPRHDSHNDLAAAYAAKWGLRTLCGSDAHQPEDVAAGGILVPEEVLTPAGLSQYLAHTPDPAFILP